eukprot:scaffold45952_cov93-Phaeocystis_antarctica.AAC.4
MEVFSYFSLVCGAIFLWFMRLRHIVTSSLVCLDINHFVHVARPWSSAEAPTARFDSRGYQVDGRLRPRARRSGSIST